LPTAGTDLADAIIASKSIGTPLLLRLVVMITSF